MVSHHSLSYSHFTTYRLISSHFTDVQRIPLGSEICLKYINVSLEANLEGEGW